MGTRTNTLISEIVFHTIMKGTYLLEVYLKENTNICIGKLGWRRFPKGFYFYVGSALNGLEKRIHRHMDPHKKIHWHIDYFLNHAIIKSIYYQESTKKTECFIAETFKKTCQSIQGFGCSDCSCESHLFTGSLSQFTSVMNRLGMKKYINAKS
ncbi:MAG: GIY-YIG nuclease family protein [Methanobacteriota archaeon]